MSEECGGTLKRFSGEDEDLGRPQTMEGLGPRQAYDGQGPPEFQRGPWLFTLLDGRALEACVALEAARPDGRGLG